MEERVLVRPEKKTAADSGVYSLSRGILSSMIIISQYSGFLITGGRGLGEIVIFIA